MHELSICQSLLTQVNNIAAEHHATSVEKIFLQVGPLSGVEPELLQSAFPIARADTIAAEAELVIQQMPIQVRCKTCHAETTAKANRLLCGECGDWQTELLSGDELLLERVEMQTEQ
jgi:hydrogenase nickel incorporation protein HypA/HybF